MTDEFEQKYNDAMGLLSKSSGVASSSSSSFSIEYRKQLFCVLRNIKNSTIQKTNEQGDKKDIKENKVRVSSGHLSEWYRECGINDYKSLVRLLMQLELSGFIRSFSWNTETNQSRYEYLAIELPESFEELSTQYLERFLNEFEKTGEKKYTERPKYNPDESVIYFKNKQLEIKPGTVQSIMCKMVFSKPFGTWITETDILTEVDHAKAKEETKRTVYDAMLQLNKKMQLNFGIESLMEHKNSNVRIRSELFVEEK